MEKSVQTDSLNVKNIPVWFQENFIRYRRLNSRPVKVGKYTVGGDNPIWLQSMVNTDTMNTAATVDQIKRLSDRGCHIARVTVPNLNTARNLETIKNQLISESYTIPIVADVHFTPQAAVIAAEIVEKVRINPGNFVDRKHFEEKEYTDEQYRSELKRVEDKLIPLLDVCRKHKTAMRLGSNHGSLSDRIFNRYGDGPEGMVQSALEFLDICEQEKFDQVIFSMKSSNTLVMVAAYRLLVHRFWERGVFYPIHLGVTEAGDDEDGRAKSALGIGSLLMDGIGDTIRVSLTEDPEKEIPVAYKIVESVKHFTSIEKERKPVGKIQIGFNPFDFNKSETQSVGTWGRSYPAQVMFSPDFPLNNKSDFAQIGIYQIPATEKWISATHAPDLLFLKQGGDIPTLLDAGQKMVISCQDASQEVEIKNIFYNSWLEYSTSENLRNKEELSVVRFQPSEVKTLIDDFQESSDSFSNVLLVLEGGYKGDTCSLRYLRHIAVTLKNAGIRQPLALSYKGLTLPSSLNDSEAYKVAQAVYGGYMLVDGLINGVLMEKGTEKDLKYLYSVLQASRQRISKPEYISCPSCGRTLFDLQEVTAKVKAATHHLVGVKIAVMGCIVNGPGEMADADFGYVGSGPGKITLYKGKKVMVRNVKSEDAVQELVNLIKREGYWQEKELVNQVH